jgi:hypothetical protein
VQGGASAAVSSPAAPVVSGKSIISSAIAAQKESSGQAAEAPPADAQAQQREAVKEMSKMFLQSTVQGIFQGFSAMPQVEKE